MGEEDPTPSGELLRLQRYGAGLAVTLLVAVVGAFNGDPLEHIFLRVMAVPLFFIAAIGIGLIFVSDRSRKPWTLPFVERKALEALIYTAFLEILIWRPASTVLQLAVSFVIAFVIFCGASMLYEAWQYRRRTPKA
jgi:hypothetical protein